MQAQAPFSKGAKSWGRLTMYRELGSRQFSQNTGDGFDLFDESFSIGKGEGNNWIISDEHADERTIERMSNNHCRISKDCSNVHNPVFIEDLSRNGTFLNGELIGFNRGSKKKGILKTGDVISFNKSKLKFFRFINCYEEKCGVPNEIFQRYHIWKFLGKGGQGTVHLVINRKTCKKLAMKIVRVNRLLTVPVESREEKILRELTHPNIIICDHVEDHGDNSYTFLDYFEGGDLLHRIQRDKYLTVNTAKDFLLQLCAAVKYLHDNRVMHRDIKPDNILLRSEVELTVVISDFGLSKKISSDSELHTLCGTQLYTAPEILSQSDRANYTNKVDIWSLGVVLYAMLSGKRTFVKTDNETALQRILSGKFNFEHNEFRDVPETAKDLIRQMLTVDPNQRPSIEEVLKHPWLKCENRDSVNELNEIFDQKIRQPPPKRRRID